MQQKMGLNAKKAFKKGGFKAKKEKDNVGCRSE
jgi:hypothetical protein